MNAFSSCRWLLATALLLLLPQLAQADALGYSLGSLGYVLAAALTSFALFTLLLVVASYLLPRGRGLYGVQLVFFVLSIVLGVLTYGASLAEDWVFLNGHNPLLAFCLPVGAWLNAVRWARQVRSDGARLVWVGVAVLALHSLLALAPSDLVLHAFREVGGGSGLFQALYLLVSVVAGVLSWVVVWWQMPPAVRQLLKQGWWRAPAVAAAIDLLYYGVSLSVILHRYESMATSITVPSILTQMLQSFVFNWIVGAAVLGLLPAPPPAASPIESSQAPA